MKNIKKIVILPAAVLAFGTLVGCNNAATTVGSDIEQYESYFKLPKGCTPINSAYAEKVYSNAIAGANEAKLVTSDTVANYKPEYYKGRALYAASNVTQQTAYRVGEISSYDCDEALQYDTKSVKFYDNNYLEVSSVVGNRRTINGNVQHLVDENVCDTIFYQGEKSGPEGYIYPFYRHAASSKESTAVSYVSPFMHPERDGQLGEDITTPQDARDVMKKMMDKYSLGYISLSNALSTLMNDFTIAQEVLSFSLIKSMSMVGIPHYVMDENGDIYFNYYTAIADGMVYNSGSNNFQQWSSDARMLSVADQLRNVAVEGIAIPGTTWIDATAGKTDFVREGVKGYDYIPTVSTMQIAVKMSRHNGAYRIDYHAAKATQSYVCDEFGNDLAKPLNFVTCYGISNASYDSNGTHSELSTEDLYTPIYQVLGIDSYARVYRDTNPDDDDFDTDPDDNYIFDVVDDPVYLDRFSTSHGETGKNQGIELSEMRSTKIRELEIQTFEDRSSIGALEDITPYEWAYSSELKDKEIYVYSGVINAPSTISKVDQIADFKKKDNADSKSDSSDYGVVYDYGITIGGMPGKGAHTDWQTINPNEYPIGYDGNKRQIGDLPDKSSFTTPLGYENLVENTTVNDGYVGKLLPSTSDATTEEDDYDGQYINRYAESEEEYRHDEGFIYLDEVTPIALTPGCSYRLTVYFDKDGKIYSGEGGTGKGMVISYLGTNVNRFYYQQALSNV